MSSENMSGESWKTDTIAKFQRSSSDTGSSEVQVAIITKRIETLASHFEKNKFDNHSRRGMLRLISRRKKLLAYLKDTDLERYKNTISSLGLRK